MSLTREEQKLRIGYSSATQMAMLSGKVIRSSFNPLLVANGGLVTIIGLAGTSTAFRLPLPPWTSAILAGLGFLVYLGLICILTCYFEYQRSYIKWTRFYQDVGQSRLEVLGSGSICREGKKVGNPPPQIWLLPEKLKIQGLAWGIIGIFALIYAFIL